MTNPLITVIIPIYNVENYLEETIESVVQQSIGFEKHIELILINDGSPDDCDAICRKYQAQYPDNILYEKTENRGVSAARNTALLKARGEFVNFLDGDDKWDVTAFEKIIAFFRENETVSVVACPMKRFDAKENMHRLARIYKNGNQVIDICNPDDCFNIHVHVTSAFFKRSSLQGLTFHEDMIYGEDTVFIETVIIKAGTLGLCADALHYYRRRSDNTSAIQNQKRNIIYYTELPEKFYGRLIEESEKQYGYVIPYIQSCIAYDMGWRVAGALELPLEEDVKQQYFATLSNLLQKVEDVYILTSPYHRKLATKLAVLRIKYGKDCLKDFYLEDNEIRFNGIRISLLDGNKGILFVDKIASARGKYIIIEGRYAAWMAHAFPHSKLKIAAGDTVLETAFAPSDTLIDKNIFGVFKRLNSFALKLKIKEACALTFSLLNGNEEYTLSINYDPYILPPNDYDFLCSRLDKRLFFRTHTTDIQFFPVKRRQQKSFLKTAEAQFKETLPEAYDLRQAHLPKSGAKIRIALFGESTCADMFFSLAKRTDGITVKRFKKVNDKYREYYIDTDYIVVFETKINKKILAPFGNQQMFINDFVHSKLIAVLDEEQPENLKRYTANLTEYRIRHATAEADIAACIDKLRYPKNRLFR